MCRTSVRISVRVDALEARDGERSFQEEARERELTPAMPSRRFEYLWQDGVQYKKPTKISAPGTFCLLLSREATAADLVRTFQAYVDCLMNWVQGMLDDESIFPSKIGKVFLFIS